MILICNRLYIIQFGFVSLNSPFFGEFQGSVLWAIFPGLRENRLQHDSRLRAGRGGGLKGMGSYS